MKTNRSPLNQQDQDSHEFDHKPTQLDINIAKIANAKMKKLRDKSFDHQFNKNEKLDEVVVNAPKNYSQIKDRDGSQLMTANEAKITDETGFRPDSVKDKEFRGGPNIKSPRTISKKEGKLEKLQHTQKAGKLEKSPLNHCESDMMHKGGWAKMRTLNSPGTTGNKEGIAHNEKMRGFKLPHQSPLAFKGANSENSSCWDGYKKEGTKPSPSGTGETVNNCVKI